MTSVEEIKYEAIRYKDDDTIVINVNEIITSKSVKPKKFLLFI